MKMYWKIGNIALVMFHSSLFVDKLCMREIHTKIIEREGCEGGGELTCRRYVWHCSCIKSIHLCSTFFCTSLWLECRGGGGYAQGFVELRKVTTAGSPILRRWCCFCGGGFIFIGRFSSGSGGTVIVATTVSSCCWLCVPVNHRSRCRRIFRLCVILMLNKQPIKRPNQCGSGRVNRSGCSCSSSRSGSRSSICLWWFSGGGLYHCGLIRHRWRFSTLHWFIPIGMVFWEWQSSNCTAMHGLSKESSCIWFMKMSKMATVLVVLDTGSSKWCRYPCQFSQRARWGWWSQTCHWCHFRTDEHHFFQNLRTKEWWNKENTSFVFLPWK